MAIVSSLTASTLALAAAMLIIDGFNADVNMRGRHFG
jgi:hypothetical protein